MKRGLCFGMLVLTSLVVTRHAQATTYYVDSILGKDTNSGTATNTAWKTLTKVNGHTFVAGDVIKFFAGSGQLWTGQLMPKGSGAAGNPIKIDMYDPSNTGIKPMIAGGGAGAETGTQCTDSVDSDGDNIINDGCPAVGAPETGSQCEDNIDNDGDGRVNDGCPVAGAAVYLKNQSQWEIRNLDVTNCFTQAGGSPCLSLDNPSVTRAALVGILIENFSGTQLNHIVIANNTIHNVAGFIAGYGNNYDHNGGIMIGADLFTSSRVNDVTIDSNSVHDVDPTGIAIGPVLGSSIDCMSARVVTSSVTGCPWPTTLVPNTAVVFSNNAIDHIGGGGISAYITNGATIQSNVISQSGFRVAVAAITQSSGAVNTTWQYNEIYDNAYGGDHQAFDLDWGAVSTTVQFNYSHNNPGGFVQMWESHRLTGCSSEYTYLDNELVRWNISINDGAATGEHAVFAFCGTARAPTASCGAGGYAQFPFGSNPPDIANNTVLLDGERFVPIVKHCSAKNNADNTYPSNRMRVVGRYSTCNPDAPSCPGGTSCYTVDASEVGSYCLPPGDVCLAAPFGSYPSGAACGLYFYNNILWSSRYLCPDPVTGLCDDYSYPAAMHGANFADDLLYGTFSDGPPVANQGGGELYADPMMVSPFGFATAETNCADAVDDDLDGVINDGCPAVGAAELYENCTHADGTGDLLDNDGDGRINDGCPAIGKAPSGRLNITGTKLRSGSPALTSGFNSGYLGTQDYWGNSVSGTPNRGAYNGAGL